MSSDRSDQGVWLKKQNVGEHIYLQGVEVLEQERETVRVRNIIDY